MTVSGVGAVGGISSTSALYALSPYLNGVTRVADAVAAAQRAEAQAAAAASVAARATAARAPAVQAPSTAAASPSAAAQAASVQASAAQEVAVASQASFANAAIDDIAARAAVQQQHDAPNASPAFQLSGDSGTVIQSYGAIALLSGPLAPVAIHGLAARPAIPAVAPVVTGPRLPRVNAFA